MSGLIERLEAAEAGSTDLDATLFRHFGSELPTAFGPMRVDLEWQDDGSALMPIGEMQVRFSAPPVTTSLDAALALAERVLPGWTWVADGGGKSRATGVVIGEGAGEDEGPDPAFTGKASTPALALCIAVLKATEANTPTSSSRETDR